MVRIDLGDQLLALLLSAVSNGPSTSCVEDPCAVCTVCLTAQSYLNDLRSDLSTGWWMEEENTAIIAAVEAIEEKTTYVEITLPDGTVCRWARTLDDDTQDKILAAVEGVLSDPDTIRT